MKKLYSILLYSCLYSWLGLGMLALPFCSLAQNITRPNIIGPDGVMVNSYTGNLFFQRTDLYMPGLSDPIDITFAYNSADRNRNNGYGAGWTFPYNMYYEKDSTEAITVVWGDGRRETYCDYALTLSKSSRIEASTEKIISGASTNCFTTSGTFNRVDEPVEGILRLTTKEGMQYFFEDTTHRKLTKIVDRLGLETELDHSNPNEIILTDPSDRELHFAFSNGNLTTLTDFSGDEQRTFQYNINAQGLLRSVTDPEGGVVEYHYGRDNTLVAITDKNDYVIDVSYDENFAVTKLASCLSAQSIFYSTQTGKTYVNEQNESGNQTTTYSFDDQGNLTNKQGNCCGYNVNYRYDGQRNVREMEDANGNITRYTYDTRGNILTETDARQNTRSYTYNEFSQITSITDKKGGRTEYTYYPNGRLREIRRPEGVVEEFKYDTKGNRIEAKDGNGNKTTFKPDKYGYLEQITDGEGHTTLLDYDAHGNLIKETDPLKNVTRYQYDKLNRLRFIREPEGVVTEYRYDAKGNQIAMTDPNGYVTKYFYDPLDRLAEEQDVYENSTTYTYDALGNQTSMTDPNGHTTRYEYDELNRLSAEINAVGEATYYRYDGNGNLTQTILPNGNTIRNDYDQLDQLVRLQDNLGLIASYEYDPNGNRVSETDANNHTISYRYDALNRLRFLTDPSGQVTEYQYDLNGNVNRIIDAKKRNIYYSYDGLNRLDTLTDPLGYQSIYHFDPAGNLRHIIDAKGQITKYSYDSLNRLEVEQYADGGEIIYTYYPQGNIKTRKDQEGKVTQYQYDSLYRLKERAYPSGEKETFKYYPNGNLKYAINGPATINYTYDAADRITQEILNGKPTKYRHDAVSNTRVITYPSEKVVVETMDGRDRMTSIRYQEKELATFNYNDADLLVGKTYSNNTSSVYDYDKNDRLTGIEHNPNAFLSYSHEYDEIGNRLTAKALHQINRSETFTYDRLDRLKIFRRGPPIGSAPLTIGYDYDAVGNRLSVTQDGSATTYEPNEVNEYGQVGGITPDYDDKGNLIADGTHIYKYDTESRLVSVSEGGTEIASFQYDALGRRIQKISAQGITNYYYDDQSIIEERNENDQVNSNYVYGTWIDDVLALDKSGSLYFYHHSALGSVAGLSNAAGELTEIYEYDAYGNTTVFNPQYQSIVKSTVNNPYGYTGRRLDNEIGLYYYRARFYDPDKGRFIQRDPLKYIDGENLYTYAQNNPVNYFDPLGTTASDPCECYTGTAIYALCYFGELDILDLEIKGKLIAASAFAIFGEFDLSTQVLNGLNFLDVALALSPPSLKGVKTISKNAPDIYKNVDKGVDASKSVSKRLKYLGKTPGKSSKTGKEVIERMAQEGKIRVRSGETQFRSSTDGKWYPLKEADMAHKTDAVTWWNKTGRYYGAKSPEVRKWMLDSRNYELEHFRINRSQGAKLRETYLDP